MFKVLLPIDINQLEAELTFLDRAIAYVKAFEGQFVVMTVMADYGSYFVSPLLPDNFIEQAKAKALVQQLAYRYGPSCRGIGGLG